MTKDMRVYLGHILECILRIEDFSQGGRDEFLSSRLIQDAVIRNLEVIGEAAKRIGEDYRSLHPEIPWRGMASLRDVLIHDYDIVRIEDIWSVVETNIPPLKKALLDFLPPLDQLEMEIAGD